MKVILGLFLVFFLGRTEATKDSVKVELKQDVSYIKFNVLPGDLINKLKSILATNIVSNSEISDILNVTLNDYVDEIFENIQQLIRNNNMTIIDIPDAHLKFEPAGHLDMWGGTLQDIDIIARREDVILSYDSSTKKLSLVLPIKFDDIKFSYDNYHAKVLLLSIYGAVHGSVTDIKVNAELSFDLSTYNASLDHYDMKNSGKVSVKFTGNGMVDWLLNAMTAVVDTFLGQVIVNVLAKLIRNTLRDVCEQINEDIANILNH